MRPASYEGHGEVTHRSRRSHWMTLTLDTGEGRELNESIGDVGGHAELRVSQRGLLVGADVRFPSSNSAPLVSHDFDNGSLFTCL